MHIGRLFQQIVPVYLADLNTILRSMYILNVNFLLSYLTCKMMMN